MARYSIDKGDAGEANYRAVLAAGQNLRIFLDGKEVHNVITADEEEGIVVVLELDEKGQTIPDGGETRRLTLRGVVRCVREEVLEPLR